MEPGCCEDCHRRAGAAGDHDLGGWVAVTECGDVVCGLQAAGGRYLVEPVEDDDCVLVAEHRADCLLGQVQPVPGADRLCDQRLQGLSVVTALPQRHHETRIAGLGRTARGEGDVVTDAVTQYGLARSACAYDEGTVMAGEKVLPGTRGIARLAVGHQPGRHVQGVRSYLYWRVRVLFARPPGPASPGQCPRRLTQAPG